MLTFFRRMRKGVLASSQTRKYILYSIGEILLVVVGILIALQVNNWSEYRKQRKLELEMLSELQEGLTNDIVDLRYNINAQSEIFSAQSIVLEWLDGNQPYHDSLSRYFARLNAGTVFVAHEAPYTALKEAGIRIIQSDTLRKKIAEVYDRDFDYYKQHIVIYQDLMIQAWQKINQNYFEATLPRMGFLKNEMKPLDLVKIRSDNAYKYHIKTMHEFNGFYIKIINRAEKSASELSIMLKQELQR